MATVGSTIKTIKKRKELLEETGRSVETPKGRAAQKPQEDRTTVPGTYNPAVIDKLVEELKKRKEWARKMGIED